MWFYIIKSILYIIAIFYRLTTLVFFSLRFSYFSFWCLTDFLFFFWLIITLLRCHLSLCLTGFGFNGLWRFAGPFSKVWLTAPINAFHFPTERSEEIVCLRSFCSFLDLLTKTSSSNISCTHPVSVPSCSPTVLLWFKKV